MPAFAPSKITDTDYRYILEQGGQRRLARKESSSEELLEEMVLLLRQIRLGLTILTGIDLSSVDT